MKIAIINTHKIIFIVLLPLLAALIFGACSTPTTIYQSESLKEIALSAQVDSQRSPVNPSVIFSPSTPVIYCSFKPSANSIGKSVSAQWIYVKGDVEDLSNYLVDEWTELMKSQSRMAMFIRCPGNSWPVGDYKVILYINHNEEISIPFSIK